MKLQRFMDGLGFIGLHEVVNVFKRELSVDNGG